MPDLMDKKLFTPGPLNTSETVKEVMLRDLGSRDFEFIETVDSIRRDLLTVAGLTGDHGYDVVIMQGSGTFGIESVISSAIPDEGKLLLIINGAYGRRMADMARVHGIRLVELHYPENESPRLEDVAGTLASHPDITHVAMVHCETTTGIFNDIREIGSFVSRQGKVFIVDAMSSFGAVPIDFLDCGISFLISSSNKCIEGVPGFSFIIGQQDRIMECEGRARTVSLDLFAQWKGLETNGQFRFTPPVQVLMAFRRALDELEEEGGPEGRAFRYRRNNRIMVGGLQAMGFETYLSEEDQGYIITTFLRPADPAFDFDRFYEMLNERGFVIYPGKLTGADTFRIGNIGQLGSEDMFDLLEAINEVISELGVSSCSGS